MSDASRRGTALVTGASSGIGKVYADRLARRGFDLILVARDEARLETLAEELVRETGVKADVLVADLTSRADLARVERRLRDDGTITMLVNNAGASAPSEIVGADLDRLETLIQLNIVALTRLAGAASDSFAARKHGAIINIASVLALLPEGSGGVYSGSKAYVLNFSQSLNRELAPLGVRVQAVLPGATRTEIWERSGKSVDTLPPEIVMETDEMVDAALAGFDRGELVTIPSLPDPADWAAFQAARLALAPNLSRNRAAPRYKEPEAKETAKNSLYLDDLSVGQNFVSGSLTVDETAIKAFAQKFDPQPFHLDAAAAEKTLFGGLAASGWHTAALTMKLLVGGGAPFAGGVIGAGGEITWPRPTRPGDTLTVTSEVVDVTPSKSRPDRGMATLRSTTANQRGEAVQVSTMKLVLPRRPAVADAA